MHPLLCAVMRGPRGWFERAQGRAATLKALGIGVPTHEMIDVPVVAFLLEHPAVGLVLVDTGFHGCIAEGPSRERSRNLGAIGRVMARGMRMDPQQTVASAALLSGDAAYTLETIRHGARPWRSEDAQAFERSVQALAAWDRGHPDALVIPGHDMDAWEGLQERYS